MTLKELIKSCGATVLKANRYGSIANCKAKTKSGKQVKITSHTNITRGGRTCFTVQSEEELILPKGATRQGIYVAINELDIYFQEETVIEILNLN